MIIKSEKSVTKILHEIHLKKKKNTVKFIPQTDNDLAKASKKYSFFMGIFNLKEKNYLVFVDKVR